jgi:hypothetical protein
MRETRCPVQRVADPPAGELDEPIRLVNRVRTLLGHAIVSGEPGMARVTVQIDHPGTPKAPDGA